MDTAGDVFGQGALEDTALGGFGMLTLAFGYLLAAEEGEDADIAGSVDIGAVEPELVEFVGAGFGGVVW